MSLPLSSPLLDQILFAMEDQDNFSVLNLATRQVEACVDENDCGEGTVIPLPSWSSSDGFRMMREFSESLHNPIVQSELKAVLDSGQGVFKRFKIVLKPRELLYRQWLRFKRKFMEEKVRLWLDEWPEVVFEDLLDPGQGAEEAGLLSSDFTFRELTVEDAPRLVDWDTEACLEAASGVFGEVRGPQHLEYFRRDRRVQKGDRFWCAENPQGEWAGVVWCRLWTSPQASVADILLWYVDPDYRGLGVGGRLLEALRQALGPTVSLMLSAPANDRRMSGPLGRAGFQASGGLWVAQSLS